MNVMKSFSFSSRRRINPNLARLITAQSPQGVALDNERRWAEDRAWASRAALVSKKSLQVADVVKMHSYTPFSLLSQPIAHLNPEAKYVYI